ncbi:phosphoribosyltransferase family protein [Seminibacterium arietis]|uniref:Phosphoribosyltransferase family protein n=1 Tax=Seminibacterium arietis TaxID=1173502 RepID=A0ABW3I9J3_9PAST
MNLLGFCCINCGKKLAISSHGICSLCNKSIVRYPYCGCCGSKLTKNNSKCGYCLQNDPMWNQMVIIGSYNEPLSMLIHRFKFQNQFWLDRTLARLLLIAIYQARRTHQLKLPDVILPVPLHHFRQWKRGYNQAELLARPIAKWLNIPIRNDLIKRNKNTPTQRGLNSTERRKNLKNAFKISEKLKNYSYSSVALVDDVITTGSTLNEIAKLLRQQGISHIQVWGLARA